MKSVCAVIVTYNRKELLVRNLRSLFKQTYPMNIIIYDNASTDGTYEYLSENDCLKSNVQYIKGEYNSGGAGGFYNGEIVAVDLGYDYIWLMDDDGYCLNEYTLERLMDVKLEGKNILNSFVSCKTNKLLCTFDLNGIKEYVILEQNSDKGLYLDYANPYNSTLIPRECFLECGYTDPKFFIYGDENDFMLKTKAKGYVWCTVLNSLYFHPVNRNEIKNYNILGLKKFSTMQQPIWKMYFETRNYAVIMQRYTNKKVSLKHYIGAVVRGLTYSDKRMKRVYYQLMAINDAKNNYLDRPPLFGK